MRSSEFRAFVATKCDNLLGAFAWLGIEKLHPAADATWHAVLRGEGQGSTFAIKVYNSTRFGHISLKEVSRGAELSTYLHDNVSKNVVPALRWPSGRWFDSRDDLAFAVFPWVHGRPSDARDACDAAKWLAGFHLSARHVPDSLPWLRRRRLDAWVASADSPAVRPTIEDPMAAQKISEAELRLKAMLRQYKGWQTCVHGDFAPKNAIVGADGGLAILDFDLSHRSPAVLDVVEGALSFARKGGVVDSVDDTTLKQFVNSYRCVRKISRAELAAAFRWVTMRSLALCFKAEQVPARVKLAELADSEADDWSR